MGFQLLSHFLFTESVVSAGYTKIIALRHQSLCYCIDSKRNREEKVHIISKQLLLGELHFFITECQG